MVTDVPKQYYTINWYRAASNMVLRLCLSACLSIIHPITFVCLHYVCYLSVHLPACLSFNLVVCLASVFHLYVHLPFVLSYIHQPISQSIYLFNSLSVCPSLSVCLPAGLHSYHLHLISCSALTLDSDYVIC